MIRLATLPCGVDDNGRLFIPDTVDVASGWHRYEGLRLQTFVDPDDDERVIVRLLGGLEDDPGFVTDGVVTSLSVAALRALAADLTACADEAATTLDDGEPTMIDVTRPLQIRGMPVFYLYSALDLKHGGYVHAIQRAGYVELYTPFGKAVDGVSADLVEVPLAGP